MCAPDGERYPLSACGEVWRDAIALEHATLPALTGLVRCGDALVLTRERARTSTPDAFASASTSASPLDDRRAEIVLQAAAAAAFYAAHGFALSPGDLEGAGCELTDDGAFLWLRRAPDARVESPGAGSSSAEALAALLLRLFARGGRIGSPGAAALLEQLRAPEARWRRPEFWVASALRLFPELALPSAASARERCLGVSADALRTPESRALSRVAEAIARGDVPRVFRPGLSPMTPGGALNRDGESDPADGAVAVQLLRDRARDLGETVWIAIAGEEWDPISRRVFEAAGLEPGRRIERVPRALPLPKTPADWRQALWVPCGSVAASVRFYERFAQEGDGDAARALERARATLRHPDWARFASDPTGDGPLPDLSSPSPRLARRPVAVDSDRAPADPGLRIERLLRDGRIHDAFAEAKSWVEAIPARSVEGWFPLASRLCGESEAQDVPWLQALEAEREIAGGRAREARDRLERLLRRGGARASPEETRRARLRVAELAGTLETPAEAARQAAAWRRAHPKAPAAETARALRLGALGSARTGRFARALALLTRADRIGKALPPLERLETALARARVLAGAGRIAEEEAVYDSLRAWALSADDAAAVRFLAQEARRLLDRREFSRAILRLSEALSGARDDAGERAELLLDLSVALYHAGDPQFCEKNLGECLRAAAAAGRDDLVFLARGNRTELWINRGAWDAAAEEIASLASQALAERDDPRLLVALHHRGRLALRRGFLDAAAADNLQARELSQRLADKLEIGELWLEEGDRRAYEGDLPRAKDAWEKAAAVPADRSNRDRRARRRLAELAWSRVPPPEALAEADALFTADPYRAAETVVRWRFLLGDAELPAALLGRAEKALRERGGEALAEHAFRKSPPSPPAQALRGLRSAIAAVLLGGEPDGHRSLGALGIAGLALEDAEGRELARLGRAATSEEAVASRPLEAGLSRFSLTLWPVPAPASASLSATSTVDSIALLLETLLYRAGTDAPPTDFAEGWRRLGLVTEDASMEEPYRRLTRFAPQAVTVLILGASGSGKEAVARAVHRLSPRASGAFVAVNVPAIPASLLESELFGHARGAFTGADRDRRGLLEEASDGTIFFDEIGDLAPPLQAKLLRALQEGEIRRVGENRPRAIDVRVVSATSVDLVGRVESGQFREDLFYRLHVGVLRLPPLKDRGRDALVLARHFLLHFAREYGRGRLRLSPDAAAAILAHAWPGNVRELQNAVAQAAALCDADGSVSLSLLPESIRFSSRGADSRRGDYRTRVDAHRRDLVAEALDRAGGNRTRAAKELGLSRQALHYLIRELRIAPRP